MSFFCVYAYSLWLFCMLQCIHASTTGNIPRMLCKLTKLDQQQFSLKKVSGKWGPCQNVFFGRFQEFFEWVKLGVKKTMFWQWNMETMTTIPGILSWAIIVWLGEPPSLSICSICSVVTYTSTLILTLLRYPVRNMSTLTLVGGPIVVCNYVIARNCWQHKCLVFYFSIFIL